MIFIIDMRKRHWKDRKNRRCPDCRKMITYTRKDTFDRAVGNNSVCKSCAQIDRKVSMDTIEKLKQPKTFEHKKQISIGMKMYWKRLKREEYKEVKWLTLD
jgi:hypothetical protein